MSIFDFLGSLIKPVTDLISDLTTTDKEKGDLQLAFKQMEASFAEKLLEYEKQLLQSQTDIIKAEATGASPLQRLWRPISMITFLVLVVCDSFGWLPNPLAPQAWTLIQIGLGGYVGGRTIEKVAPAIIKAVKNGKNGNGG